MTIPHAENEIRDLVRRCIAGEDAAWEAFYSHCGRVLPACIHSYRLPGDWSEEIFQDFLCHLFDERCRVLRAYRPQLSCRFDSWLRICYRRFTLRWLKKGLLPRWDPSVDPAECLETERPVRCEDAHLQLGLARVLEQLSERESRMLSLRIQGYSHREIGQRLTMKEGAVSVAMQRLGERLRVLLSSQVLDLDPRRASSNGRRSAAIEGENALSG